jgi:hypothetical protein
MVKLMAADACPIADDRGRSSELNMNVRSFTMATVGPMAAVGNLREIVGRCQSGKPLDEALARWLAFSLDRFLHRRCSSIEDAFGLRAPRGGVPWWLEEAIRIRDAALRELAQRHFAELSVAARARRIHSISARYGASAWRHDRENEDRPERYSGTPTEFLWRAFKSGAPMPVCERQLRNILASRGPLPRVAAAAAAAS